MSTEQPSEALTPSTLQQPNGRVLDVTIFTLLGYYQLATGAWGMIGVIESGQATLSQVADRSVRTTTVIVLAAMLAIFFVTAVAGYALATRRVKWAALLSITIQLAQVFLIDIGTLRFIFIGGFALVVWLAGGGIAWDAGYKVALILNWSAAGDAHRLGINVVPAVLASLLMLGRYRHFGSRRARRQ
jgi:hypothetical protein